MNMRVSLTGLLSQAGRNKAYRFMLAELCKHLKMLRDAPGLHGEFFELYVFEDGEERRAKVVEAGQQPATQPARNAGTGGNPTEYQPVTTCGG